ncbi:hypothetical protein BGX38DRAFT_92520 [Terfezia claveryi]|nr:hypothetical protein BGX38DRAFT_92520 [Terfezia claveryi]
MKAANVSQPPRPALDSGRSSLQMQSEAKMRTTLKQVSRGTKDDDSDIESVIIVRTSPRVLPKQSSPFLRSSPQLPAQRTSPSTELPLMTRPSPPKDSPIILSMRESAPAAEQFTPPVFPQTMSSAGPFSPLPPMALPLRPATPNTFRVSFGNQGAGFGSPGLMGSADVVLGPPTMSSSNGKRKRMSGGPKVLIPGMHSLQKATDEEVSDTIIVSQPSSTSEKTDEDESENAGKKRKIKGIMKKTQTLAAVALPSPGVERAELLFDMDRLSIENEAERSKEHLLEQQGKLGAETGIATGSDYNLENGNMQDDEEKTDEINGGNTIPEEDEGDSGDHLKEKHTSQTVKPLPSRRRFRSPPPPPLYMDEDEGPVFCLT